MGMPLPVPTYTSEDLRQFPRDGQRYELLEGTLLVTPAPTLAHQLVTTRLARLLAEYLDPVGLAAAVTPGEIEVAPSTVMDPDILVVPASYPADTPWTRIGGWWLAVEVYSPSSRLYDHDFKRPAYLTLGVREVWMVDPVPKKVFVSRAGGDGGGHLPRAAAVAPGGDAGAADHRAGKDIRAIAVVHRHALAGVKARTETPPAPPTAAAAGPAPQRATLPRTPAP